MTRWMLAGFMALVALGAVGAPAQADPPANPFAGSWSGTWSINEGEIDGTYDWTISDAGRITGTVYSITADHGGPVVGHVDADGKLGFVGHAPAGAYPFKGTAVIDGDGKLVVSVTASWHQDVPWSLVAILERN